MFEINLYQRGNGRKHHPTKGGIPHGSKTIGRPNYRPGHRGRREDRRRHHTAGRSKGKAHKGKSHIRGTWKAARQWQDRADGSEERRRNILWPLWRNRGQGRVGRVRNTSARRRPGHCREVGHFSATTAFDVILERSEDFSSVFAKLPDAS